MIINSTGQGLPPLKVSCTDADCDHGLHCFKFLKRRSVPMAEGSCRYCGTKLVNWVRLHARALTDVVNTFSSLETELIRHHFWHKPIDEKADLHARRKGMLNLREAASRRIHASVGPANPTLDGRQTPMQGNILFLAQHATASCCRTCMEYWHAIPKGRELTNAEVAYFTELIMLYVARRMPHLPDGPEKIPRRRRGTSQD